MTTTSNDPDEIRRQIERTRSDLSRNVNELGDTVSPSSIAERQKTKVRRQVTGWKDRIMGAAEDVKDRGSGSVDGLSDKPQELAQSARSQTQGNPLAAGLIALGAGWLLGSILPASSKEQEAAGALKEKAEPMMQQAADEAKQAGQEMAEHLKEPAQQSMDEVTSTARDSAQEVKSQAQSSAADVKDTATDAAQSARSS